VCVGLYSALTQIPISYRAIHARLVVLANQFSTNSNVLLPFLFLSFSLAAGNICRYICVKVHIDCTAVDAMVGTLVTRALTRVSATRTRRHSSVLTRFRVTAKSGHPGTAASDAAPSPGHSSAASALRCTLLTLRASFKVVSGHCISFQLTGTIVAPASLVAMITPSSSLAVER
jgi:hypothetical protein